MISNQLIYPYSIFNEIPIGINPLKIEHRCVELVADQRPPSQVRREQSGDRGAAARFFNEGTWLGTGGILEKI